MSLARLGNRRRKIAGIGESGKPQELAVPMLLPRAASAQTPTSCCSTRARKIVSAAELHKADYRPWKGADLAAWTSLVMLRGKVQRVHRQDLQERACGKCAVPGGSPSQRCIDSSQPDEFGAGKSGSAKQPTAMPQVVGLRSPSQKTLVPQLGQK